MNCPARLQELPCALTGVGYLREPVRQNDTTLRLMKGQGANFPELIGDQFFFVSVEGCDGCCENMRVVARDGDTLTVERTNTCDCINSNARISYDHASKSYIQAAAREIGLNVTSPLAYDCATNTLSLDCNKLATDSDCGCGGGGGGVGVGGGGRGEQGAPGRDGKDGLGIESITVDAANYLRWTDSNGRVHNVGQLTATAGPRGEQGVKGEKGEKGDPGPQGESAGTLSIVADGGNTFTLHVTNEDGTYKAGTITVTPVTVKSATVNEAGRLVVTMTDDSTFDAGSVVGPRGLAGERGSFNVLHNAGRVYVSGPAGSSVSFRTSGRSIGQTVTIPPAGVWSGANPNTGAAALVEVVHDGGVVAIGYF